MVHSAGQSLHIATLCVGLSAVLVAPAHAQSLTHLGQPTERHVTLVYHGEPLGEVCNDDLSRVSASGGKSAEPFVVPARHVLVVTDVEWRVLFDARHTTAPRSVHLNISVSRTEPLTRVFMSRTVAIAADAHSWYGTSEQLTSGFLVGPGTEICASAWILGGSKATADTNRFELGHLVMRGYFMFDRPRRATRTGEPRGPRRN